jgi:hypothetical protein
LVAEQLQDQQRPCCRDPGFPKAESGSADPETIHGHTQEPLTRTVPQTEPQQAAKLEIGTKGTPLRSEAQCEDNQVEGSPDSPVAFVHHILDGQVRHRNVSLDTLNRCPTFVRRHAPSLIPKALTGQTSSLAMLNERGTMSTPVLSSSTPTKQRARLQRRIKPKPTSPKT